MQTDARKTLHAFTLIELSVVLIIIALLVGGIVVGKSLIRSSELHSAMQEYARYVQAIGNFRDKYHNVPGDFAGAETIWGTAAGGCPDGTGTGTETCNGDGNGKVGGFNVKQDLYEPYRAWQHLSNAQLIDGGYSGIMTSQWWLYTVGTDIPASRLGGAGWRMFTISTADISTGEAQNWGPTITYTGGDTPPNLVLWLGGPYFEDSLRMSGVLTPLESYEIDLKTDDGKANSGQIITQDNSGMDACDDGSGTYSTTGSDANSRNCVLLFKTGY